MSTADDPVYQMLWDCKFCGHQKLLGQTHRHCPNCGAPQNAAERYFPSDTEKVRAEDHEYAGADLVCTHCGEANGRRARHCGNCGAPIEGGADVRMRADRVVAEGEQFRGETKADARAGRAPEAVPAPRKSRSVVGIGCLAVLAILVVAGVVFFGWRREAAFVVSGHSWTREITVEAFGPVSDSSWCDALPVDAVSVRRAREVRSHDRVPDGEDCHVRKVDRGNGTFVEKRECEPRYRDEPVYGDRCYFTVNRWRPSRKLGSSGSSLAEAPVWPAVSSLRTGNCVGCEREGSRREKYVVELTDPKGTKQTCDVPEARWTGFADGSAWKGATRVVGGTLDCGSLVPR
ncbi:MAG TPA: hypothetical protein VHE30_20810 [Polyangiaceae bacterium]|nr:hypothetical protein [Polyangiaceae bacterium]